MSQFASTDDLGDYLGEPLSEARLLQGIVALELASARIQGYTRQRLERVSGDTITFTGTYELELPQRPVVEVESVIVSGTLLASTAWTLVDATLVIYNSHCGRPVVDVIYTHGFDPIPDDVRAVTLQLAAQTMSNPLGVRQEGIGSYSVSYGDNGAGNAEALLKSLSRYRRSASSVPVHREYPRQYPVANV